jgi:putative effector of murein hydrolase
MTNPFSIWVYLSATPLLWLALTLVAWIAADALARACGRHPLVNPVLIAIAVVGGVLVATGTPYQTYFEARNSCTSCWVRPLSPSRYRWFAT